MEPKLKIIEETFSTSRGISETIHTIVSKLMDNTSLNYKLQSSMRDMTRMESMVINLDDKVIHRPFQYLSDTLKNTTIKEVMIINGVEIIIVANASSDILDLRLSDKNYRSVLDVLWAI